MTSAAKAYTFRTVFFMLGYLWAGWDSRKRAWQSDALRLLIMRALLQATCQGRENASSAEPSHPAETADPDPTCSCSSLTTSHCESGAIGALPGAALGLEDRCDLLGSIPADVVLHSLLHPRIPLVLGLAVE